MKIAYLAQRQIPSREANSIHVMKMCQAFSQEGHEVRLMVPLSRRGDKPANLNEIFRHYGINDPFDIQWIRESFSPWTFILGAVYSTRRMKFDIVYTRSARAALFAVISRIPTIYETHAPPAGPWAPRYFRAVYFSKKNLGIVVITDALRVELQRQFPKLANLKKIVVASDGIDLERFQVDSPHESLKQKLRIESTQFVIGYAGHLYKGRGIDLILDLAARLKWADFLVIGGEERDIQIWKQEISQKNLSNVHLIGFVPNVDIPGCLEACDVLIMPYQRRITVQGLGDTSQWCSPMKMFEYMAAGRMIISSDLPVLKEVLRHGHNSWLCPPDDLEKWIEAVTKARDDKDLRMALAKQALWDVQQFTWKKRVQRILDTISLVSRSRHSSS